MRERSFPAPCLLDWETPARFALRFLDAIASASTTRVSFAIARISEEGLDPQLRSGEPFLIVGSLDRSLRETRKNHPDLSLGAWLEPAEVWPRQPCWMLGEYLAERDLFLWIDLRKHPPEKAVDWLRTVVVYGLASGRTFALVDDRLGGQALSGLDGSGVWLMQTDDATGKATIEQR